MLSSTDCTLLIVVSHTTHGWSIPYIYNVQFYGQTVSKTSYSNDVIICVSLVYRAAIPSQTRPFIHITHLTVKQIHAYQFRKKYISNQTTFSHFKHYIMAIKNFEYRHHASRHYYLQIIDHNVRDLVKDEETR